MAMCVRRSSPAVATITHTFRSTVVFGAASVSLPGPFGLAVEGYLGADAGFLPATRAYGVFFGMTFIPAVLWRPEKAPGP
jgi:hypothetical protein